MHYRKLGRTDIEVSEFVFGCGKVGGIMIDAEMEIMRTAVQRSLAAGINWFDTAAQYGDGRSEHNLGLVLKDLDAHPHVSTKFMIDPGDTRDVPGQIESKLHASLGRLNLEKVALLQLHNPIEQVSEGRALDVGEITRRGGVLDAMARLREEGLCDWIGVTALGDAALCREIIESGSVDTAQVYYNMINPSAAHGADAGSRDSSGQSFAGLLDACAQRNVGVFAIRVLAAGVLATDKRHGRESILTKATHIEDEERKARAVFDHFSDKFGTRAQTALRFALSHPSVSCVDFAVADLAQLDEGLAAADMGALPDDAVNQLDDLYRRDYTN